MKTALNSPFFCAVTVDGKSRSARTVQIKF